ncbi:hypothetical protein RFI_38876, partial [Reticulomyxa filosa]
KIIIKKNKNYVCIKYIYNFFYFKFKKKKNVGRNAPQDLLMFDSSPSTTATGTTTTKTTTTTMKTSHVMGTKHPSVVTGASEFSFMNDMIPSKPTAKPLTTEKKGLPITATVNLLDEPTPTSSKDTILSMYKKQPLLHQMDNKGIVQNN